jgi:hypothetical protein
LIEKEIDRLPLPEELGAGPEWFVPSKSKNKNKSKKPYFRKKGNKPKAKPNT